MQFAELLERTGARESTIKEWLRRGVLLAAQDARRGAGTYRSFDDANLIAAAVAMHLTALHVPVTRYAEAFQSFHLQLRNFSSIEWRNFVVAFKPNEAVFVHRSAHNGSEPAILAVDLARISEVFLPLPGEPQLSLVFGVSSVR